MGAPGGLVVGVLCGPGSNEAREASKYLSPTLLSPRLLPPDPLTDSESERWRLWQWRWGWRSSPGRPSSPALSRVARGASPSARLRRRGSSGRPGRRLGTAALLRRTAGAGRRPDSATTTATTKVRPGGGALLARPAATTRAAGRRGAQPAGRRPGGIPAALRRQTWPAHP